MKMVWSLFAFEVSVWLSECFCISVICIRHTAHIYSIKWSPFDCRRCDVSFMRATSFYMYMNIYFLYFCTTHAYIGFVCARTRAALDTRIRSACKSKLNRIEPQHSHDICTRNHNILFNCISERRQRPCGLRGRMSTRIKKNMEESNLGN